MKQQLSLASIQRILQGKHAAVILALGGALLLAKAYDAAIIRIMQEIHSPILTSGLGWITSARSVMAVLFIMPSLFLWENRKTEWMAPLITGFISATLISFIPKMLINRRRPYGAEGLLGEFDTSFPSGHTSLAFAAATILSRAYPSLALFWYSFASLVGIGRMYGEVHYASDVLGGVILGLITGWTVLALFNVKEHTPAIIKKYHALVDTLTDYKTEFRRKLLHMCVGVGIVMLHAAGYIRTFDLFIVLVCGIGLSFVCTRYKVPGIYWLLDRFERKHTYPGKGAITFFVGAILALKLFPVDIAYASILVLALGDGFSAIIGPFGSTKTFLSEHKLIEGTLAGIVVATIGAQWFVTTGEALAAATVAMSIEATEIKLNNKLLSDNILVPIVAGTTIVLIRRFTVGA